MLKNILILGFRADVGSYVVYSYPKFDAANSNLDVMNIYNLHRFRTTERNFQLIQQGGFNIASYYSGFKNTNYIGQPDYCVTLLLGAGENPNEYERPLMKVTNNLLADLGGSGFEELLSDTYVLIDNKQFDEIKISRRGGAALDEAPLEHKAIATTSSATLSDEEKIFQDLMGSADLNISDSEFDSKKSDFDKSGAVGDPFSSDPFSRAGATASDPFAENPFSGGGGATADPFADSQKPSIGKMLGIDDAVGKAMFTQKRTTAADIVARLDQLEKNKPIAPAGADETAKFMHLESLVSFLEEKVKMLGTLANSVRDLEKSHEEKDALIGKLLLLLKNK